MPESTSALTLRLKRLHGLRQCSGRYSPLWREQGERVVLAALPTKKRGRKEWVRDPLVAENEKLRRENERITKRLRQAEIIIDVQKKVSQILGIQLATPEEGGHDSCK